MVPLDWKKKWLPELKIDKKQALQHLLSLVFFPCWCITWSSFPAGASHGLLSLLVHHMVFFPCWCFTWSSFPAGASHDQPVWIRACAVYKLLMEPFCALHIMYVQILLFRKMHHCHYFSKALHKTLFFSGKKNKKNNKTLFPGKKKERKLSSICHLLNLSRKF